MNDWRRKADTKICEKQPENATKSIKITEKEKDI